MERAPCDRHMNRQLFTHVSVKYKAYRGQKYSQAINAMTSQKCTLVALARPLQNTWGPSVEAHEPVGVAFSTQTTALFIYFLQ